MSNAVDIFGKFAVLKLQAVGWDNESHTNITQGINGGATCTFVTFAAQAGQPDAAPYDQLCHLAFHAPVLTRRQRADRVKRQQAAFFNYFKPEAQEILRDLLEKYASDGELQFTLPDVLKLPPISLHGNVCEIIGKFGGADQLRAAVNQLQSLLYAQ